MKKKKITKYILLGAGFLCLLIVFFHFSVSFKGGFNIHGNIARAGEKLEKPENPEKLEEEGPGDILGWIIGILLNFGFFIFSRLLAMVGKLLNWVFSIETFSNIPAINMGWGVLRDLSNMFFIPILMVSAVATIVRYEKYSFRNMISPLLIAIVFINFSRTIANIVIDFTQVLTRSFLSFSTAGGGISEGIVNTMGLTSIFRDSQVFVDGKFVGTWTMAANTFLALLVVAIAAIVIGIAVILLFMRMIMLWILITLSPIAWGLYVIPDTKKYLGMWWGKFKHYAFFAPVFAFFIWFALLVVRAGGYNADANALPASMLSGTSQFFADPKIMINYIFSIGILIFGLKYAQTNAGDLPLVGTVAKKAEGFIKKTAMGTLKAVTPYRTVQALRSEHKERVELKEKLKKKDAAITAGNLYKRKDAIATKVRKYGSDFEGQNKVRNLGFKIGKMDIKPLQWITREKSYSQRVTDDRVKDETEKTRIEKINKYKDVPPEAKDVQTKLIDPKTDAGELKALAQHLAENTDKFSKAMGKNVDGSNNIENAIVEFQKALKALGGKDSALGSAFVSKVKKSRLDLVIANETGEQSGSKFEEAMKKAVAEMDVKGIAGQDMAVFENQNFVDAIGTLSPKVHEGLAKSGMSSDKMKKIEGQLKFTKSGSKKTSTPKMESGSKSGSKKTSTPKMESGSKIISGTKYS